MRCQRSTSGSAALVLGAAALVAPLAGPAVAAPGDMAVSDQTYVRYDGGSDATLQACSVNNRQQNEPTGTVAPHDPQLMTSGANDYCTVPTTTDTWAGFYYSSDGGSSWANSLVPGYPTDQSPAGQASPLNGLVTSAGDPVQAWDNDGHLYYGGIAFNRAQPTNGSIWVARYDWPSGSAAPSYEFTTLVSRGTPTSFLAGIFEDKVQLEVDRGADSRFAGNVYMCWARFTASPVNNGVFLARSSDGGRTFQTKKISAGVHGNQFCDIAVTRSGTVFVAWRQFQFLPETGQMQDNAVVWTKSTNGGRTFTKPNVATEFVSWDLTDQFAAPEAAGQAAYDTCRNADHSLSGCFSPEPKEAARSCGDGPFTCRSGYVFFRANTQVRITADPTTSGDPDAAYVVYDASVPGSQVPTGTTFGTVESGTGSQASTYFIKTSNGGRSWSTPARIDAQARGHQFFPDIHADGGVLHAVWQDSRSDPTTADFRTVPIANQPTEANPPGAVSAGPAVDTFYASSTDGGASWSVQEVSDVAHMPQYEQFGDRDTPFFGDYNYIAASGDTVLAVWTDERDTVPGDDPRYPVDGMDGFDVLQCRTQDPDGTWSADTCPDDGGLNQNIYGAVVSP